MKKIILITCVFGLNFNASASLDIIRGICDKGPHDSDLRTPLCGGQEYNDYKRQRCYSYDTSPNCTDKSGQSMNINNTNVKNVNVSVIMNIYMNSHIEGSNNTVKQQVTTNSNNNNNDKEPWTESFIKTCLNKCKEFFMKKHLFKNCMGN